MSENVQTNGEIEVGRYKWVVMAVVMLGFMFTYGFDTAVTSPIIAALPDVLDISVTTAAAIVASSILAARVISTPFMGVLTDLLGSKKSMIIVLIVNALGWLVMFTLFSVGGITAGRVLMGLVGGLETAAGTKAIAEWFTKRERSLAMGIWSAALPLTVVWASGVAGTIIAVYGLQKLFLFGAFLCITGLVPTLVLLRPAPVVGEGDSSVTIKPSREEFMREIIKNQWLWLYIVAIFFYGIVFYGGVMSFWVKWLTTEKGIEFVTASWIMSSMGLTGIIGSIGGGFIAAWLKRLKPVFIIPAVVYGLSIAGLNYVGGVTLLTALSLLVGFTQQVVAAMMFAIVATLVSTRLVGTATGAMLTAFSLGGVIGPVFIGHIYTTYGLSAATFILLGSMVIAAVLVSMIRKLK